LFIGLVGLLSHEAGTSARARVGKVSFGTRPACRRRARGSPGDVTRSSSPNRTPILAGAALVALGAALAVRRRAGLHSLAARGRTALGGRFAEEPSSGDARRDWRCACGQAYVVTGTDRHRIYWLAGADEQDPVLGGECPECGRPLPAEHEAAVR
jgi:hypothetical protein